MSTIKSSAENLTLNADGANNDIKFQSNGSEVASIDQAGTVTATTFTGAATDATKLPLAGGTMSGNLVVNADIDMTGVLNGTAGSMDIKNEANNENIFLKVTSSGSEVTALKIHSNGVLELPSGGLRIGGDAAANTLSDYEEGTWTMVMTGSSSGSGNVGTGHYTKIGRMVHCMFTIDNATSPTFSGNMQVSLPFTGSSGNGNRNEGSGDCYTYPLSKWTTGSDYTGVTFQVYGNSPTTGYFQLKRTNTNRQSAVNSSQGSNSAQSGFYARFSITYTAS
mgnify:CR=1 FL=1